MVVAGMGVEEEEEQKKEEGKELDGGKEGIKSDKKKNVPV